MVWLKGRDREDRGLGLSRHQRPGTQTRTLNTATIANKNKTQPYIHLIIREVGVKSRRIGVFIAHLKYQRENCFCKFGIWLLGSWLWLRWEPHFDGWKAAMWLWMRGSVDPAALSIVGPPSARGSIWTTPNHWLAPRRLLGLKCPSVAVGGKANS